MSTVKQIIHDAGGVSAVAIALDLTDRSIYKWIRKDSLPRSEYTGESNYSAVIAEMCSHFTKSQILEIGNPRKLRPISDITHMTI